MHSMRRLYFCRTLDVEAPPRRSLNPKKRLIILFPRQIEWGTDSVDRAGGGHGDAVAVAVDRSERGRADCLLGRSHSGKNGLQRDQSDREGDAFVRHAGRRDD